MSVLETQVAKIQIGTPTTCREYIHLTAERATNYKTEIYAVYSLPLLHPGAISECEKIVKLINNKLRKTYRNPSNATTFEGFLSSLNEELATLGNSGLGHRIPELSCVIVVKEDETCSIASCGNISCLLFRRGMFSELADKENQSFSVQKVFSDFTSGQLVLGDVLILSSMEMFNYLGETKLQRILEQNTLQKSAQEIISVLQANAGTDIAFGTILALLSNNQSKQNSGGMSITATTASRFGMITESLKALTKLGKKAVEKPVRRVDTSKTEKIMKSVTWGSNNNVALAKATGIVPRAANFAKKRLIILIGVVILLSGLAANLYAHNKNEKAEALKAQWEETVKKTQTLIQDASDAINYKDNEKSLSLQAEALQTLNALKPEQVLSADVVTSLKKQIEELQVKAQNKVTLNFVEIAVMSKSERLWKFGNKLVTNSDAGTLSFSLETETVKDDIFRAPSGSIAGVLIGTDKAVTYNGDSLTVWNLANGETGLPVAGGIPAAHEFGGLAPFAAGPKVFIVNKAQNQILNLNVTGMDLGKPVVWNKEPVLTEGVTDIAVDGSVYVLWKDNVSKYTAGRRVPFTLTGLETPLTGGFRMLTSKEKKNLYILDKESGTILVVNKEDRKIGNKDVKAGEAVLKLQHNGLQSASDFEVDEDTQTIYTLVDGKLYKSAFKLE